MAEGPSGSECQCISCGAVFGSLRSFDAHQEWRGRADRARLHCKNPQMMGLEARTRRQGVVVWVDAADEALTRHLHGRAAS